jgi:hypothetical protein
MSTAIPGEVWRPTSAEKVQHLGLVEEIGNQGDFIGRAYRRLSKNECRVRKRVGHTVLWFFIPLVRQYNNNIGFFMITEL